jgi:hypothetical protein
MSYFQLKNNKNLKIKEILKILKKNQKNKIKYEGVVEPPHGRFRGGRKPLPKALGVALIFLFLFSIFVTFYLIFLREKYTYLSNYHSIVNVSTNY